MNGRCHKDALDRAEDICELCGEQFCASCLLFPRGHRHPPTCKGCALANSGLRGAAVTEKPISRREYKKRKKALLAQLEDVEEEAPAIDYLEFTDPSGSNDTTELDRRSRKTTKPEPVDDGRDDETPAPRSHKGHSVDAHPTPPPPTPPPPTSPPPAAPLVDDPVPISGSASLSGLAPVDTSVNPLAVDSTLGSAAPAPAPPPTPPPAPAPAPAPPEPEPEPVSEASASAADLLARLKADQPIQSQFTSQPRPLDVDPFAPATTPPAAVLPPTEAIPPGPTASIDATPISPTSDPFAASSPPPSPAKPKTEPWTPPAIPPRGSNLDAMSGSAPPGTATPAPSPAPPPPTTPDVPAGTAPEAPPTAPEAPPTAPEAPPTAPEAPPTAPEPEATEPSDDTPERRADTDTSGQWIPPSLRGMAPAEDRAADPLPRRR